MRWAPTCATTLGDHRYDDRLAPRDAAAIARAQRRARRAARAAARDRRGKLGDDRSRHARAAARPARGRARRSTCARSTSGWSTRRRRACSASCSYLVESHTVTTADDARQPDRAHAAGRAARSTTRSRTSTLGLADGRVSSAEKVRRAIEQLDAELAQAGRRLGDGDAGVGDAPTPIRGPPASARAARELRDVVATQIAPAFVRLRDFLRDRVLPTRAHRAGGPRRRCPTATRAIARRSSTTSGSRRRRDELHELGLAEIARTDRELAELGKTRARHARSRVDDREAARRSRAVLRDARADPRRRAARARSREGGDPAVLLGAAEDRLRDARDPRLRGAVLDDRVLPPAALRRHRSRASTSSTRTSPRRARGSSSRR